MTAPADPARLTVWYDGACPLCVAEISLFRRWDRRGTIAFVDVSAPDAQALCPISVEALLARFHAREAGGPLVSGAAAFAAMWRAIPLLAPLGHAARFGPILWGLERLYLVFLRLRPRLQAWMRTRAPPP